MEIVLLALANLINTVSKLAMDFGNWVGTSLANLCRQFTKRPLSVATRIHFVLFCITVIVWMLIDACSRWHQLIAQLVHAGSLR